METNSNEPNTENVSEMSPEIASVPTKGAVIRVNGGAVVTSFDPSIHKSWPDFSVGDTVNIHYRIKEGDKERIQTYEGNVITIRGEGLSKSFVVRRISHDVGVERIFPYHSPSIAKIELMRKGKVRRSRLFYLRDKSGKAARIKELFSAAYGAKPTAKKAVKKAVKKSASKKTTKSSKS